MLANPAIVRADITEGKPGVPSTLVMKLVDINNGCAPIEGSAVHIWHTDKDGVYSGYAGQPGGINATGQSFMRGVQVSNASGQVVFQTIYPGWYTGRITHIHFRAYLTTATNGTGPVTSQIAFPPEITTAVYNSTLYPGRGQNTSLGSFAEDGIFRNGVLFQLAQVTGNPAIGYVATLIVGVRR